MSSLVEGFQSCELQPGCGGPGEDQGYDRGWQYAEVQNDCVIAVQYNERSAYV